MFPIPLWFNENNSILLLFFTGFLEKKNLEKKNFSICESRPSKQKTMWKMKDGSGYPVEHQGCVTAASPHRELSKQREFLKNGRRWTQNSNLGKLTKHAKLAKEAFPSFFCVGNKHHQDTRSHALKFFKTSSYLKNSKFLVGAE